VKHIASYCTSGAGLGDTACENYWDLFVECGSYTLSTATNLELQKGVKCGRGGRGVVYVFAAGNEGLFGENVNFEGFLMSTNSRILSLFSSHAQQQQQQQQSRYLYN
jgi:hypothetical protein